MVISAPALKCTNTNYFYQTMSDNKEKLKALQLTIDKLEKTYGKGTVMKLNDQKVIDVPAISTGSLGLDIALGIGGERMTPDVDSTLGPRAWRPNRESEVVLPSDMMAFGDGLLSRQRQSSRLFLDTVLDDGLGYGQWNSSWDDSWLNSFRANDVRHSGRFNVAFLDGHIEHTRYQLMWSFSPDRLAKWNNDHQPHSVDPLKY